jgi:hypothetical protein
MESGGSAGSDLPCGALTELQSGSLREDECKNCALARVISGRDSTAVRLHGLLYDREAQAYAGASTASAFSCT